MDTDEVYETLRAHASNPRAMDAFAAAEAIFPERTKRLQAKAATM